MNVRLISIQLGIVAALLLALWQSRPGDLPVGSGSRERLLTIPDDRLVELEISGPGEAGARAAIKLTRPELASDKWVVASHHDHPMRSGLVARFVKALRDIRMGEVQTEDTTALSKFDLDDAQRREIVLYGEGRQELAKLVVGKVESGGAAPFSPMGRPDDSSVGTAISYILHQGKVRRVPGDLRELELDKPTGEDAFDEPPDIERDYTKPNYWLDRTIFKIKTKERDRVVIIALVHGTTEIVLQRLDWESIRRVEDGPKHPPGWKEGDPTDQRFWRRIIHGEDGNPKDLAKVNESTVQSLLYALNLSARAIARPILIPEGARGPAREDLEQYGFVQPALMMQIVFDDDTAHRLFFGKVKTKGDGGVEVEKIYCMLPGAAVITEIKQKEGLLGQKPTMLLLKRIPVFEINNYELEALLKKDEDFKPTEEKPADGSGSGSDAAGSGSGSGSGSDAAGSGSGSGSDAAGSGSGSGSEAAGSGSGSGSGSEAGSGSGSGSEAAGSGSGSGSEAAGSGSGSGSAAAGSESGSGSMAAGSGAAPPSGSGSVDQPPPAAGPTRHARLILIAYEGARDSRATRTKDAARLLAVTLYEQLTRSEAPASFADLARQHSDDPSAQNGGDLGLIAQGARGPAFGDVLFALDKGAVSTAVELPEGFAIIQRVE